MAKRSSIKILKTPYRAPKANAICGRFLGSVRRECLDHLLILGESHLYRVIREYIQFFNQARPHQGIEKKFREGSHQRGKRKEKERLLRSQFSTDYITITSAQRELLKTVGTNADEVFGEQSWRTASIVLGYVMQHIIVRKGCSTLTIG